MNNQNFSNRPYSSSSNNTISTPQSNKPTNQYNSNQSIYNSTSRNKNYRLQSNSSNRQFNNSVYNTSSSNYYQRRYDSMKGISRKKDLSTLDGASYLFAFISFISFILWCSFSPFNIANPFNAKLWSLTIIGCFFIFGCFIIYINISYKESIDIQNGKHWIILFLFLVSFFISTNLLIRVINAFDLRSEAIVITEFVKNRKETGYHTRDRKGHDHEHRTYYLILGDKDKTSGEKMITVSKAVYENAENGDHWITKYKPGLLGIKRYSSFPYIVHNHLTDKIWDERMRQLREKVEEERAQRNKYYNNR